MLTNYLFIFLIIILMGAILTHPAVSVAGAAAGLMAWFHSVLPSLFPFMVLTGLLVQSNTLVLLSQKLKRLPWLSRLPITPLFAVITGLLCGYPMGIRTVSQLQSNGQLTRRQASFLRAFVNQPGPMFVLGYALPLTGLANEQTGVLLLAFYGGVAVTALLAGFTSLIADRASRQEESGKQNPLNETKSVTVLSVFEQSLMSSMVTLGKIGGYMILFSVIAALISELFSGQSFFSLVFSGLLEMTSGLALTPSFESLFCPYVVLGFISFGGLSVAAQSFSLGKLSSKEQLHYLLWKVIQTLAALIIYSFLHESFFVG